MLRSFSLIGLLLTTVACTQAPAQIDLRGQNSYSRNGTSSYAANNSTTNYAAYQPAAGSPSFNQTQSAAATTSIGVNDLSPPTAAPAAQPVPFKASSASSDTINPWTHKPRDTAASSALDQSFNLRPTGKPAKEQMVSDIKPVVVQRDAAVHNTGLESIVSDSGSSAAAKSIKSTKIETATSANFMWPVSSKKVLSQFGPKGNGKVNDGINIASSEGEPVWAAADGEVVYIGNELQGYGNMVLIKHNGDKVTTYAHLSRYTVDKYDRIKQGDIIGYVGNTGNVKEPQLHFAVRDGKDAVDPIKYLNRDVASLH